MKLWEAGVKQLACIQLRRGWNTKTLQALYSTPILSGSACPQLLTTLLQAETPRHLCELAEQSPGRSWIQSFNRKTVISLARYIAVFQKSKLKKDHKRSSNPKAGAGNVWMIRARSMPSGWDTNIWPDMDWTMGLFCHLGCLPSLTRHHWETQRTPRLQDNSSEKWRRL